MGEATPPEVQLHRLVKWRQDQDRRDVIRGFSGSAGTDLLIESLNNSVTVAEMNVENL